MLKRRANQVQSMLQLYLEFLYAFVRLGAQADWSVWSISHFAVQSLCTPRQLNCNTHEQWIALVLNTKHMANLLKPQ